MFSRLSTQERALHRAGLPRADAKSALQYSAEEQAKLAAGASIQEVHRERAVASLPQPFDPDAYEERHHQLVGGLAAKGLPGLKSIVTYQPHSDGSATYDLPGIKNWPEVYAAIFDHDQEINSRLTKGNGSSEAAAGGRLFAGSYAQSQPYRIGGYAVDAFGDGNFNRAGYGLPKEVYYADPEHEQINTFYLTMHTVLTRAVRIAEWGANIPKDKIRSRNYVYVLNSDERTAFEPFQTLQTPQYNQTTFSLLADCAARSVLELDPSLRG